MEQLIYNWIWDRIDLFLVKKFNYSRNFFHHIFERWWIFVNWKKIKKSYQLKDNDNIQIDDLERYLSPIILEESPKIDIDIKIEKSDYLVIFKPKWVLSHPGSVWDIATPSVVGFLYHRYKDLPTIWNFIRAWLIHRLDKETDWYMIIAKTEKWLEYFKGLFQKKSESNDIKEKELVKLKKYYQAKSNIKSWWKLFLESIKDKLPHYIIELVKPKIPHITEYKTWITKILWFDYIWENQLKIDIEILTWRTHQIRYHLSNKWLPIIWDYLYWEKENVEMWLSAYKLEFEDIDWEYMIFN